MNAIDTKEFNELLEIRRDIHRHPEISGHENETMERICKHLTEWNIPFVKGVADTGVVATIVGEGKIEEGKKRPVIGIRADIDALPIQEETGLEFASENEGAMHACGHDMHTTIGLGTARRLSLMKDKLKGTVKFFFQPNEEDTGGAERMIQAGCLDEPNVDAILGLHVNGEFESNKIGIKYGKMYAASDMLVLDVYGTSAHGASPHDGIDAIAITMNILNAAQTIVSRNTDPVDSAVITFGTIHGGNVRNQIADHVQLTGIIRTVDDETREKTQKRLTDICESVAEAMGGSAKLTIIRSYRSLINTDWVVDVVKKTGTEILGEENVLIEPAPSLGTEDFAFFAAARPSCFFHLGVKQDGPVGTTILHNCHFNPDEKALWTGVEMQTANALAVIDKLLETK